MGDIGIGAKIWKRAGWYVVSAGSMCGIGWVTGINGAIQAGTRRGIGVGWVIGCIGEYWAWVVSGRGGGGRGIGGVVVWVDSAGSILCAPKRDDIRR
jgi:hypothetical protein